MNPDDVPGAPASPSGSAGCAPSPSVSALRAPIPGAEGGSLGWKWVPDTATHRMLNAANSGRKKGRSSSGAIYAAMLDAAPEAPPDLLRQEQAGAVMPLIGPLLDAWDGLPNYLRCDDELSELRRWVRLIARGMEAAPAGETEGLDPEGATARSPEGGRAQQEQQP